MSERPFHFGTRSSTAASGKEWADLARRAEDLGYEAFHIVDHYQQQLAMMPALTAAACATSTIRVGPLVAAVDYHHPVWFAKECATVDLLSDGRFILGIGAGWMRRDYAITGTQLDPPSTRIARLDEALTVIQGLWNEGPFAFDGTHYRVAEIEGYPKPISRIPVLVGGGGRQILSLAARRADIVGLNPRLVPGRPSHTAFVGITDAALDERVRWVRQEAGERFAEIELHLQFAVVVVTDEPADVVEAAAEMYVLTPDEVRASPYIQIGPLSQITENVLAIRERWGITSLLIPGTATLDLAPMVAELS